jgi:hypothetical protein
VRLKRSCAIPTRTFHKLTLALPSNTPFRPSLRARERSHFEGFSSALAAAERQPVGPLHHCCRLVQYHDDWQLEHMCSSCKVT